MTRISHNRSDLMALTFSSDCWTKIQLEGWELFKRFIILSSNNRRQDGYKKFYHRAQLHCYYPRNDFIISFKVQYISLLLLIFLLMF